MNLIRRIVNKKYTAFFILGVIAVFCVWRVCCKSSPSKSFSGYIQVPVSFSWYSDRPVAQVQLEEKTYKVMVDTGSSHFLDLQKNVLDQIHEKKTLGTSNYFDVQGTKYSVSRFLVPEISFHPHLKIGDINVYEESLQFLRLGTNAGRKRSALGKIKNWLNIHFIHGRLGWPLFEHVPSLFDLPNQRLYLAKDFKTLERENLFISENFIRFPLEISRCGPVLSLEIGGEVQKFLLDSGATHSAYRNLDPDSEVLLTSKIVSQGIDLGSWTFIPYLISSELSGEIDGILGVDFFKAHAICFDPESHSIYIEK